MIRLRRRLASLSCGLIKTILPPDLQSWATAISTEVSEIDDDTRALLFAVESLFSFAWRYFVFRLFCFVSALAGAEQLCRHRPASLIHLDKWKYTPQAVGVLCAICATFLGFVFMKISGAPIEFLAVNFGALVVGFLLSANLSHSRISTDGWRGVLMVGAGLLLVATALFGLQAEGITRWIKLGPLVLQPSLVLLPIMIVAFVGMRTPTATLGMVIAAFALALQPDRAMAAALAAAMLALLFSRRDQFTVVVAIASFAGFVATLMQPDSGQLVPFVDQIIFSSFDVNLFAGLAVVGGLALLLLPALAGLRFDGAIREASLVFGVTWASIIIAAALGNYPTPLVGYSGAAVLGYVLSLTMLPTGHETTQVKEASFQAEVGDTVEFDASLMLKSA